MPLLGSSQFTLTMPERLTGCVEHLVAAIDLFDDPRRWELA
jgi:hypothetical protein